MMMNFKKNQNNAVCSMDCKNCPHGASQPNPMDDPMFEKSIAMLHNWLMLEAIREDHPKERIVMVILPGAGGELLTEDGSRDIFEDVYDEMKKPDAITCIEADSFREKIWCLPAADLLGVGRATEKVLSGYGIHTIGELAATSDDFLKCRLGKNGLAIKKYANGLDDSPVMRSDYVSPVKSIGHGITTMQDLENNAEVWCVMLELVQEIGTKLRTHKKKAGGIAISIRNNELFTKEWQCRISIPTQSPTYLAKTAFYLFAKNYQWEHPIRSVTVRAINLFEEDCPIQYDLFTDVKSLDRQERLDAAIEQIRFRFGKDAIKNGVLFQKSKMPIERKVDSVMPTGMIG